MLGEVVVDLCGDCFFVFGEGLLIRSTHHLRRGPPAALLHIFVGDVEDQSEGSGKVPKLVKRTIMQLFVL